MVVAPSRWRTLNSGMSVVKRRVTSMTGSPSLANAATGKLIRMVLLLAACTASEMGSLGSAVTL